MMQRKPGFPSANCGIKMPNPMSPDPLAIDEEIDHAERRQQLINFGHMQWGFNNWNWRVTKQDLDFVDFSNGKYCAGVVAFVSVTVKSLDIHRENIGYATSVALNKGLAIHKSRRCAVTNALRETLLSFGGTVATELMDVLDPHKAEIACPGPMPPPVTMCAPLSSAPPNLAPTPIAPEPQTENNQNIPNKNAPLNKNMRKESADSGAIRSPHPAVKSVAPASAQPQQGPPVARAHPMPVTLPSRAPPAPRPPALAQHTPHAPPVPPAPQPPPLRPDSNESRPLESMTEEEARAERKRRQQRAQEEFRRKLKQPPDDKPDAALASTSSSAKYDNILMDIPTQDIEIEQSGEDSSKRKSPVQNGNARKRAVISRLDIVAD